MKKTLVNQADIFKTNIFTPWGSREALVSSKKSLSYSELDAQVNAIANALIKKGMVEGQVIGVYFNSRIDAICSILAILRIGCSYLPLDPIYPKDRLAYMLKNSGAALLISDSDELNHIPTPSLKFSDVDFQKDTAFAKVNTVSDLGYIIYTSGSTGLPKGVMMKRSVLNNLIAWQNKRYSDGQPLRTAQFSSLSFDVSFQEIFSTFCMGGTLYLIEDEVKKDFKALLTFIDKNKIERIFMPYIALLHVVQWACRLDVFPGSLKEVITAGEQLLVDDKVKRFFEHCENTKLYNQYGPSESHVVTEFILKGSSESWPEVPGIGKSIDGAIIHILDENQRPVKSGEIGEIYIAGPVLASGYINNEIETKKRFLKLSINGKKQASYRTGDLASEDDEGCIHYKGRVDNQVKISGYRVEVGEVEAKVLQHKAVKSIAVTSLEKTPGQKELVGFIVLDDQSTLAELQTWFAQQLPPYMIPKKLITVDELLKTPSGKIDRKKMVEIHFSEKESVQGSIGNLPEKILKIISSELGSENCTAEDNLVDQGMDSLAANRIVASFYDELSLDVPAYRLFQHKDIASLIKQMIGGVSTDFSAKRNNTSSDDHSSVNDIAIIGMSLSVPGADNIKQFWENLVNGTESITVFDGGQNSNAVNVRGLLKEPAGFDAGFFKITPAEAEFIDPQQRLMLELAWHALEDAGFVADDFNGRVGVYCGVGNNTYYLNNVLKNTQKLAEFGSLQAMIANEKDYTATRISHKLNLKGPSVNILTACSTSLVSVCEAVESLRSGACDIAVAGGAAITFPQQQPYEYQDGGIFSKDGHTRTFDKDSSGTVFSDGGGMIVLKRLDYAKEDGDTIHAVINGVAINNDGAEKGSFSAPSIEGQKNVIVSAHIDAKISAEKVGYIEAHGTATPLGDPIEVEALKEAFSVTSSDATDKKQFCYLGSVKSNFGHLTAAAGVVGLIKSALSVKNNFIPPTINFKDANDDLNITKTPFRIAGEGHEWSGDDQSDSASRIAGVSSFGIGGTNAHVVLSNHIPDVDDKNTIDANEGDNLHLPVCISAKSKPSLLAYLEEYSKYFSDHDDVDVNKVIYSSQYDRQIFQYRASITIDESKNGVKKLSRKASSVAAGSLFKVKNIVFAFPGQGTQTLEMGMHLYRSNTLYKKHFDDCASILRENHDFNIEALLCGDADTINETVNAQPALFVVSYSLARLMIDAGVKPGYMLGHSIGELVAATISGVFDLASALKVVCTRASLMQAQPFGDMASANTSVEVLSKFMNEDVVIAANNSPQACTISGPKEKLALVLEKLKKENIDCKLLKTSHAFHSPLMKGAQESFVKVLKDVVCNPPKVPFVSCVSGDWITDQQATSIDYWAEQIVAPVMFREGVEKLAKLDNLLFLEVGPRQVLSGLCLQNLPEKEDVRFLRALPKPSVEKGELDNLSSCLGEIWESGIDLQWSAFYGNKKLLRTPLPLYPFQHKNFYIEPDAYSLAGSAPGAGLQNIVSEISNLTTIPESFNDGVELSQQGSVDMKDLLIDKLKQLFSDSSGLEMDDVDAEANFFELGLDSLFLTQASLQLKKEFKVAVTFRQLLNDCNTLSGLSEYLLEKGVSVGVPKSNVPVAAMAPAISQGVLPGAIAQGQLPSVPTLPGQQPAGAGLTNLFAQQMQVINQQMQMLSQSMSGTAPLPVATADPIQAQQQPTLNTVETLAKEEDETRKMPFGASVRINVKRSNELDERQDKSLQALMERYNDKFSKSKIFAQENRKHLADPRVVSGFRNTLKEIIYPIVVERSSGAHLWDINGNKFVDMTCGFGSNFFGNGADFIRKAISKQLETGYEIGPQNPMVADVAKMFCELTNSDRVAFCNTGSEAVLGAIRLARTVTAKDTVVMFENDYHGINDEVIVTRGRGGKSVAGAAGIPGGSVSNTVILEYGDPKSLEYIKNNADDIAAILIEPVQSRYPDLQPKEFLQDLRKICTEGEVAFIFDEVITGLRIHPNGAQGHYGIQSDIATYGKIIGGGMPIGVIAGKREFLDALDGGHWQFGDDSAPEVGVTYFAGTFVRHPLALAAAKAILLHLKENPTIQEDLNKKATAMVTEINNYCQSVGAPIKLPNCGSLFKVKIPQDISYEELLYVLLREKGIHIWDARPCFITTAHSEEDIQFFINAFKQSVDEMQEMGFLPREKVTEKKSPVFDASNPPVAGARLGKKPNGDPAWFVADDKRPGKYKLLATN